MILFSWCVVLVLVFQDVIQIVGQHNVVVPFHMEVHRQVHEDLRCGGMNMTSVILTATTSATFEFTEHQRHGIKLMMASEDNKCLLSKLITGCLDKRCEELCAEKRVSHCTRYAPPGQANATTNAPDFKSGTHGDEHWRKLTHLKWEFISTAFKLGVESVLWIDADMLLLKNPYLNLGKRLKTTAVLHMSDTATKRTHEGFAIHDDFSCDAPVHTGFMLLSLGSRNFKYRVVQLAEHMLERAHADTIMKGGKLEQEVLQEVMNELEVSHCSLPKLQYTGACHHAHDDGVRVQDVVTYHANCGRGELTREQQLTLIRHMLGHQAQPDKEDTSDVNPFDP